MIKNYKNIIILDHSQYYYMLYLTYHKKGGKAMSHDKITYPISKRHDLGYKSLLSHKQICLDLLHSFVNADWATNINEDSLIEVNSHFVTPKFKSKESDKIYRLSLKDKDIYFYLLLELQSTVDFLMPFRLLSYMVELWRQIIVKAAEKAERKNYRLPVIIPIVLYNGKYNWTALRNFKEKLDSFEFFEDIIPDVPYLLIDVNRYSRDYLKKLSNTISSIFIIDQKYDIIQLYDRLIDASDGIKTFESDPYNAFKDWFSYIVCENLPMKVIEEFLIVIEKSSPEEVEIMISNLAETIKEAQENAKNIGIEQGIEQGIEKGIEKGIVKGMEKGIEKVAKNLIQQNLSLDFIANATELPLTKIQKIANELKCYKH